MHETEALARELERALGAQDVRRDEPMARHTTFQIGGPADLFVTVRSEQALRAAVGLCAQAGCPVRVMGRGSNLLVADEGLHGACIQIADGLAEVRVEGGCVHAQAGASNAAVAEAACAAGLAGYEFASGIPGSIGGAAVMNAGAYDGEFADVAVSVRCLDGRGGVVEVPAAEACWGYRTSMMMHAGLVVLAATLALRPGEPVAIRARMDDLARRRAEKQPLDLPSAGSTFKRPTGHFVGKLVQDAGLRGFCVGGAQVSEKHTGFVVNAHDATAADVRALIAEVSRRVLESSGVRLVPEVRMWGFADDPDAGLLPIVPPAPAAGRRGEGPCA